MYNIGLSYAYNGFLNKAEQYWQKALARDPKYLPIYMAQGAFFAQAARWEDSLAAWQKALELEPEAIVARVNVMSLHLRQGNYESALALLDADEHKDQPDLQYIAALCRLKQGDSEQAWASLADLHTAHPEIFSQHAELTKIVLDPALLASAGPQYAPVVESLRELLETGELTQPTPESAQASEAQTKGFWASLLRALRK